MNIDIEILKSIRYIGLLFEILSAIIGTIFLYKYKDTLLKYFLVLLWYTAINDVLGMYLREYITNYNGFIYNIYYVVNFSYLFVLYKNHVSKTTYKKSILVFLILYILSTIIYGFFENYKVHFQSVPYIIASFLLIISIIFYFIEILNSEKVLVTNKNLLFWISIGFLIYYVGNIPFRILRNYYEYLTDAVVLFLVNFTLTVIKNICFIIGFICSDKKQQY